MAYKTKYMRFIEDLQKTVPDVLNGFSFNGTDFRCYKGNIFRAQNSFFYQYNEDFDIELYPENFFSKRMEVDKWNIVLWQLFPGQTFRWIVLKHESIYDPSEIQEKVKEYITYIQNLKD